MNLRLLTAALLPLSIAGCFNLSGLSGSKSSFSCAAPEGVSCMSVAGVSENIKAGTFDKDKRKSLPEGAGESDLSRAKNGVRHIEPGMPLRTPPRVVRVWFKDFEDSDEDLISELYTYMTLDTGRWQIDHARRRLAPSISLKPPPADPNISPSSSAAPGSKPVTAQAISPTAAGAIKFQPSSAPVVNQLAQPVMQGEALGANR